MIKQLKPNQYLLKTRDEKGVFLTYAIREKTTGGFITIAEFNTLKELNAYIKNNERGI